MKQWLYKFDQASIWIRGIVLLFLLGILGTGYLVYGKQQAAQAEKIERLALKTKKVEKKISSSDQDMTKKEEEKKVAEDAVKKLEEENTEENLKTARDVVEKITEAELKKALQNRIQLVADKMAAEATLQVSQPQLLLPQVPTETITPSYTEVETSNQSTGTQGNAQ